MKQKNQKKKKQKKQNTKQRCCFENTEKKQK